MTTCNICKKKIPFLGGYFDSTDKLEYCKECWKNREKEIEGLKINEEEVIKGKIKEEKYKVVEFKRKCKRCGKVWYSLVKEEKHFIKQTFLTSIIGFFTIFKGNDTGVLQAGRNIDSLQEQLSRANRCPNCGSTNYTEEISTYDQRNKNKNYKKSGVRI